jgi:hypothetical protein
MSKLSMRESKFINAKSATRNLAYQKTSRLMSKPSMKESKIINAKYVTRRLAN